MKRPRAAVLQGILSLVLALALWTFVSFTQNPTVERRFNVPVAATNPPNGLTVVDPQTGLPSDINQVVNVLAAGPRATLDELQQSTVQATVDLSNLPDGPHLVPIDLRPQGGVRVREYTPQTIPVRLEPVATQTFSITIQVVNRPPFVQPGGDAITVATDQAIVYGTQDAVARVAEVRLRIDLQGRLQSYTQSLPLEPVNQNGNVVEGVTVSPDSTNVTVNIEPRVSEQPVSIVPQITGTPPPGYTVERYDWTPKITNVIAPVVITSTLQTEPVTLNGRTESFTQTVHLVDLNNIVTDLPNNSVVVMVQIAPVVSNVPLFVPTVTLLNRAPDVQLAATPQGFTVTVRGTYQQLSQLAGAVIQASVNVQGRGPGTYTLPVEIQLPDGVRVVGDPPTVTITLVADEPPTPTAAPPTPPATQGG